MKKLMLLPVTVACLGLASCALQKNNTSNLNQNQTSVVLAKKNFAVVGTATGEAYATYFMGIGGLSKNGLRQEARAEMIRDAKLQGTSKVLINETTEEKNSIILIWNRKKVICNAQIVEFTE